MKEYLSLLTLIYFLLSCFFNNFGLKCFWSTDMHKIDHSFLFLSLLFQSSLEGGGGEGGCVAPTCFEPYIYIICQRNICFLLSKINNQSHLISNLSHMLCGRHLSRPLLLSHLLHHLLPFWPHFLRTHPCLSSYDPADCQLLLYLSSPT